MQCKRPESSAPSTPLDSKRFSTSSHVLLSKSVWVIGIHGLVPEIDIMGQHGDLGLVAPSWCLQQLGSEVAGAIRTGREGPAIIGKGDILFSLALFE